MHFSEQILHAFERYRVWLLVCAGLLLLATWTPNWRVQPDSAVFLGAARNLAESRGFVFNEQTVTSVNPGLPYLLAAMLSAGPKWVTGWGSGDDNLIVLGNLFVMACAFGSIVAIYLLMLRHAGRPLAVLVTVLTAINSVFIRHSNEILADVPFLLCCTLALLGYEFTFPRRSAATPVPRQPAPIHPATAAGLLAGAALMLTGFAGMASLRIVFVGPLTAILIDLVWRVRRSGFKWAMLAGAGAILLFALAIRLADPRMAGGVALLAKERQMVDLMLNLPARLPYIIEVNAPRLFFDSTPRALFGNKAGWWPVDLLISFAVVASGVMLLRRRLAWAALVAILFVQWLVLFPDPRYFLPVLPLLILGWWDLAVAASARSSERWKPAVLVGMLAFLALPNLARTIGFAFEQHQRPFLERYMRGRYQDLEALASSAKSQLPPDSVIIAGEQFATALHYFTGLRTISMSEQRLLRPIPAGRPVFALLPADPGFDAVLRANDLTPAPAVLSGPDRAGATLSIIPLR